LSIVFFFEKMMTVIIITWHSFLFVCLDFMFDSDVIHLSLFYKILWLGKALFVSAVTNELDAATK